MGSGGVVREGQWRSGRVVKEWEGYQSSGQPLGIGSKYDYIIKETNTAPSRGQRSHVRKVVDPGVVQSYNCVQSSNSFQMHCVVEYITVPTLVACLHITVRERSNG